MKRWIGALLCVLLLMQAAGVLAEGSATPDEPTCTHPNAPTVTQKQTTVGYQMPDATGHYRVYDVYEDRVCPDCGETLAQNELVQSAMTQWEEHTFDENGLCGACSYQVCQHGNATVTEEERGHHYVDRDDQCHVWTYDLYRVTVCPDCGYREETLAGENLEMEPEPHNFSGGVCVVCGHKNTCLHEHATVAEATGGYSAVARDNLVHVATYDRYEETLCEDCGESMSKLLEKNHQEVENHTFTSDGLCVICGHQNTCDHANATVETDEYFNRYAFKDSRDHVVILDVYESKTCPDCAAVFQSGKIGEKEGETYQHYFKDGVCPLCGYENACTHPNARTEEFRNYGDYESVDNKYHLETYDLYEAVMCPDCMEVLSEETLVQSGVKRRMEHRYDEQDVCLDCSHRNTGCAHERVDEQTYWSDRTVTSSDDTYHTFVADIVRQTYCLDCGFRETTIIEEDAEGKEPHYFSDSEGGVPVCYACGYKGSGDVCRHENTVEEAFYDCAEILSQTATHHKMNAVKEVSVRCADCGVIVTRRTAGNEIVEEEHKFELGKCWVCGYANPCQHERTSEWYDYMRTSLVSVTETEHTMTGDCWKVVGCETCGDTISRTFQGYSQTFTTEHEFDDEGVCIACHYKATAKPTDPPVVTPGKTPGKTPAPANTPEPDVTFTPTARPAPAATAEPTPEPTAEPTAAPMVDTLLTAVQEAEAEGSEVTVEVVGAEEIMTETEYTALKALPAQEQILVTLASIGFEDVVEAATKTMNVELSDGAKTLVAQVTERMAAVTQEEKAVVEEKLAKYFPVEEVVIDGVKTSYFVIDLRIEVDGVVRVERYGFRLDENGEWIFVKLDLQSVQW